MTGLSGVLIQNMRVTHRQMHRQTDRQTYGIAIAYTCASVHSVAPVKILRQRKLIA